MLVGFGTITQGYWRVLVLAIVRRIRLTHRLDLKGAAPVNLIIIVPEFLQVPPLFRTSAFAILHGIHLPTVRSKRSLSNRFALLFARSVWPVKSFSRVLIGTDATHGFRLVNLCNRNPARNRNRNPAFQISHGGTGSAGGCSITIRITITRAPFLQRGARPGPRNRQTLPLVWIAGVSSGAKRVVRPYRPCPPPAWPPPPTWPPP